MGMYDNYPLGVSGSSDYFNKPDYPTCPECEEPMEYDRYGALFCANCRSREGNQEVDE